MYLLFLGSDSNSLWSSIKSTFSGTEAEDEEEGLNIFCLATGHLYERLLKVKSISKKCYDIAER